MLLQCKIGNGSNKVDLDSSEHLQQEQHKWYELG